MNLIIEINLDNAAFADSLTPTGLKFVLKQVYKICEVPGWPAPINEYDWQFNLRDTNGNIVGAVEVTE